MRKMAPPKRIKFFMDTGKWAFLSPMYPCPVKVDGILYKSAEHVYQSSKAATEELRAWIRGADTGYIAKERAHSLKGSDGVKLSEMEKVAIMRKAFMAKFLQNQNLQKKLLATGSATLLEDNPNDLFWGINGSNWVGRLVMEAREAARKNLDAASEGKGR